MVDVIEFPPVGITESEWTYTNPVSQSNSMFNSSRYASAFERERRICRLTVSSLGTLDGAGAGYMEVLKRLLKGSEAGASENLVRIYSLPINHARIYDERGQLGASPLEFTTAGNPLQFTVGGNPLLFTTGGSPVTYLDRTVNAPFWDLRFGGLPPSVPNLFLPGDFFTFVPNLGGEVRLMGVRPSSTNPAGQAWVRFMDEPPEINDVQRIYARTPDVAVFETTRVPRSAQRPNSDWPYSWEFREVFEDETDGFNFINPW